MKYNKNSRNESKTFQIKFTASKLVDFVRKKVLTFKIFYEPECFTIVSYSLLVFEIILNVLIINRVSYTEIDWSTYMQQVECFLNGTLDYESITGDTGPIVYPAGHLYIYTILYFLTGRGANVYLAQHIFALIYLATIFLAFKLYQKYSNVPPYVLIFMCCTSYRVHSIYVLRLFNDTIAMFLLYSCLTFLARQKWILGSIFFSLAVSIKMNILLFAPGLFLLYNEYLDKIDVLKNLASCALVQLTLALPFLSAHPMSYVKRSFNLGRVFMHRWTVNYRFLPEQIFINSGFHSALLLLHLATLWLIFRTRWINLLKNLFVVKPPPTTTTTTKTKSSSQTTKEDGRKILITMFLANFIGIVFARSLHYQFYIWYYHSLAFILWNSTKYKPATKICILGLIELVWNIYPSTIWSSALLHLVHIIILFGLLQNHVTGSMACVRNTSD